MATRTRSNVIVAVGVLIVSGLLYRHWQTLDREEQVDRRIEDFLKIHSLTPQALVQACGAPVTDSSGRIVSNDGIRDLHYTDDAGRDLAFRFIAPTSNAIDWQGLGAWNQAAEPDPLGMPVDDAEAVRRLSCLRQWSPRVAYGEGQAAPGPGNAPRAAVQAANHRGPGAILVAAAYRRLQDFPMAPQPPRLPTFTPPVLPSPIPSIPNLSPPTLAPSPPGLAPSPLAGSPMREPGGGGSTGGGGGSGGDEGPPPSAAPPLPIVVPCRQRDDPLGTVCKVLEAREVIHDIEEGLNGSAQEDALDRAVRALTGRDLIVVQLPETAVDRKATIKEILRLDIKVTNIATQTLRSDLARLTPFRTDSPEEVRRKWLAVQEDERQLRGMWRDAVATARQQASVNQASATAERTGDGSRIRLGDNAALRQLVQVKTSGWGGN